MLSKDTIISQITLQLAPHSLEVAKKRYLKQDADGKIIETPAEMFYRVAEHIAAADHEYQSSKEEIEGLTGEFYRILASQKFSPGGRALFEAGNAHTGQLSSCFVLPIDDTLDGIFTCLKNAAIVQKNNGGTGFNFSSIRQKGAAVKGVAGVAAGPIHYIRTFDQAFSQLLQGSKRHGGNMGILNVNHPDIEEFIDLKEPGTSIKNFNLSVGVGREFMECVRNDSEYELLEPHTGKPVRRLRARDVFSKIVKKAWECADPGLLFLDAVEEKNPTPNLFRIVATNPCGEEPLGPNESCNLASVILPNHVVGKRIDWEELERTVKLGIHFLDNMVDKSRFPLKEIDEAVKMTRKLGLGILGFGQMLFQLEILYSSNEAVELCEKIMKFIEEKAIEESARLAETRGVFPAYAGSVWEKRGIRVRNAALTSIAPTGTISILANTTSGIEPCFSLVLKRRMFYEEDGNKNGGTLALIVDSVFEKMLKERGCYSKELLERVVEEGSIQEIEEIPEEIKKVFVTTHDISYEWHVKMQAAAQKWTDAAVSKTVNFPNSAAEDDVRNAYILAYELGCKGITIYRDGSKESQVLFTGSKEKKETPTLKEYLKVNKDEEVVENGSSHAVFDSKNLQIFQDAAAIQTPAFVEKNEVCLTPNAITVLEKRALLKNENGEVIETPEELFRRVAQTIACAEALYPVSPERRKEIEEKFFELLGRLEFIPGQALRNASSDSLTLSACLVLPIADSIESILETLKENVIAHKATCGTGINYSHLRQKSAQVGEVGPIAAGPVAFMRAISVSQKTVQTKGGRAQGSMGILNVDHPDIEEFISCKDADDGSFDNMNLSVGITDAFMQALQNDTEYELFDPRTKEAVKRKKAREIFDAIVDHSWRTGDPGIIFINRINSGNPTPSLGTIESTNVCGEQPLLPYETCNLGSIVLSRMLKFENGKNIIDWKKLEEVVYWSVRFLDNTIDLNRYPLKKIEEMSKKTRRIGLGVMGFADMLISLGIPYNSEEAVSLAEEIMKFIQEKARAASVSLAAEKGSFEAFPESIWKQQGFSAMRNSAVTTIAPTGYTSIVANCSSGIEPVFALAYQRGNSMGGVTQIEIHQEFERVARKEGFYSPELMEKVLASGSVKDLEEVPEDVKKVFVVSHDISPEWDIRIQAAFQKYTDNAVSKTINFPEDAARDDIALVYQRAYDLCCKGVTIYRDGSKKEQVLSRGAKHNTSQENNTQKNMDEKNNSGARHNALKVLPRIQKLPRPDVIHGTTYKIRTGYGELFVTINHDETGRMFEVFATIGKAGGVFSAKSEAICRLISLGLRSGILPQDIVEQLKGIRGPMPIWGKKGMVLSIPDAIAQVMSEHIYNKQPQLELDFDRPSATEKNAESQTETIIKTEIKEIKDTELQPVDFLSPTEPLLKKEDEPTAVEKSVHHHNSVKRSIADIGFSPECPECHNILELSEGCMTCRACGFSKCG